MSEFFHSTLFTLLLAQSGAFVCDRYIASLMDRQGIFPPFYDTMIYDIHEIVTALVFIITTILCCIKYSWWLIILLPIINLIASSVLAALFSVWGHRILGWFYTRFLAVIATMLLNIAIVLVSWVL